MNLPVVNIIHPKSNKFVTGINIKVTINSLTNEIAMEMFGAKFLDKINKSKTHDCKGNLSLMILTGNQMSLGDEQKIHKMHYTKPDTCCVIQHWSSEEPGREITEKSQGFAVLCTYTQIA